MPVRDVLLLGVMSSIVWLGAAGVEAQDPVGGGVPEIHVEPTVMTVIEPGTRMWTPPQRAADLTLSGPLHDHVPGRLIVAFEEGVVVDDRALTISVPALDAMGRELGLESIRPLVSSTPRTAARHRAAGLDRIYVLEFSVVNDVRRLVAAYQGQPGVRYAEPDYLAEIMQADPPGGERFVPNDPMYELQWGLNNTAQALPHDGGGPVGILGSDINAEQAWLLSTGSSNITVAILDTGVNPHSEFEGRMVPGYNHISNNTNTDDVHGHGTAVAGIAAAAGNNAEGIAGVAWDVNIMPMRVCTAACPSTAWIAAIIWSTDEGANVINLSLGGPGFLEAANEAINYAHAAGTVVFAATGNHNASNPHYPASYENSISVGALSPCNDRKTPTTCDGETWWGSGFGSGMDFLAPGTRIHSTDWMGGYTPTFNGTSAASPFAAGVGALILSVNPDLTPDEVRAIMQSTATDMGTPGYNDDTGFGRVNAGAALVGAQGAGIFSVTNVGAGTLEVGSIVGDQTWLSVTPAAPFNLDAGESQHVEVVIDWNQLDEVQSGTLTVTSNDTGQPTVAVDITAIPFLEPPEAIFTPSIKGGIMATIDPASTATRTLSIANAGEEELEFEFTEYTGGQPVLLRNAYLPILNVELDLQDFVLPGGAQHSETVKADIETQSQVIGFTFEGTLTGITGTNTWASHMSLTITGPGGQSFAVGGFGTDYPEWDFQGPGSTSNGTFTSTHIGVFDGGQDAGPWQFDFEHHWDAEMVWSDVTITLHRMGVPVVTDVSPAEGTVGGGHSVDVTLTFDAADLDLGIHLGALSILTNQPGIGTRVYPVALIVDGDPPDPPQAAVDPGELFFTLEPDSDATASLTLSNEAGSGAEQLDFSISVAFIDARSTGNRSGSAVVREAGPGRSGFKDVIIVDPLQGSVAPGTSDELTVTADTKGLEAGEYHFEIIVETNDPQGPTLRVSVYLEVNSPVSGEDGSEPLVFAIEQNYPNPFATKTTIEYSIAEPAPVTITVYDTAGRQVATLVDAEMQAGKHRVMWDASSIASGVYLYWIRAGDFSESVRAVVMR